MNFSIKTKEILLFIFLFLSLYALIILLFAYFYYSTNSIGMTVYSNSVADKIDFRKAIYFSIVSFHTIGFGDIRPMTDQGRFIVMIQSTISLFYTAIFSGFLIYFVIKRPRDIFLTRNLYIRYRNDGFWLSIRVGNKGRPIIDLNSKFEAWIIENNTRVRIFQHKQVLADLERILYFDIHLNSPGNEKLKKALIHAIENKYLLHMKFSFIGNDIRTGEQVAFAKYYDSRDLKFGTLFLNVYSWDTNGQRKDFRWKNFERIGVMDPQRIGQFNQPHPPAEVS
jgi:hypothetical protein